jgi:hypothetical protein
MKLAVASNAELESAEIPGALGELVRLSFMLTARFIGARRDRRSIAVGVEECGVEGK